MQGNVVERHTATYVLEEFFARRRPNEEWMNRPIIVYFPFVGDRIGGSHISAVKLIRGLDSDCVRPLVGLHQTDGELAKFLDDQELSFVPAPDVDIPSPGAGFGGMMWSYFYRSLWPLREFLTTNGVEIVHTNDGRMHALWAVPARMAGAKLIWHHRADPRARGVNLLAPILASHIVTVSRFSQPRRPVLPVRHKCTVVHSPFDHPSGMTERSKYRNALIAELGCPPETRFLGFFGSFTTRKRPMAFVEIVHAYTQRYPELPVAGLLFGSSPATDSVSEDALRVRAAELGVEDRIHIMGFRYPVEPYLGGVDINLVPAHDEPFGRTLIEAMLLGTPVIATNHGGNPEAIVSDETGYLVGANDPQTFTAPIHRLLSDAECWRRISETARKSALARFSRDKHVQSITEIYRELSRGKRIGDARPSRQT